MTLPRKSAGTAAFGAAGFGTEAYLGAGDVMVLRAVGAGDAS